MSRRVFSENPISPASVVAIGDSEAHHLLHVLRVRPGDALTLFDGAGGEFAGEVVGKSRNTVDVQVGERLPVERELPFALTLAAPLPKGDRARWLIEKAVEIGVARLVPLQTERSEAGATKGGDKLQRYIVEASKQCGRNRLLEIAPAAAWGEWLAADPPPWQGGARGGPAHACLENSSPGAEPPSESPLTQPLPAGERSRSCRRWVAHPGGVALGEAARQPLAPTLLAVGPEGGFTDAEIAAAVDAGWDVIGLGPQIMRIETAAIALATAATLSAVR